MKYWRFGCLLALIVQSIAEISGDDSSVNTLDSQYGAFKDDQFLETLTDYSITNVVESYKFLMKSAKFSSYDAQRNGFAKLFKKLSDDTWEDAINTFKYITKRGGIIVNIYPQKKSFPVKLDLINTTSTSESLSLYEALDTYKRTLAAQVNNIHSMASRHQPESLTKHNSDTTLAHHHDPEAISFIENKFSGKHAEIIRDLAGHFNDVATIVGSKHKDPGCLALHLFDEYLQSRY